MHETTQLIRPKEPDKACKTLAVDTDNTSPLVRTYIYTPTGKLSQTNPHSFTHEQIEHAVRRTLDMKNDLLLDMFSVLGLCRFNSGCFSQNRLVSWLQTIPPKIAIQLHKLQRASPLLS